MVGINQVLKICWDIVNKSRIINNDNGQTVTLTDNKTVLQALALRRLYPKHDWHVAYNKQSRHRTGYQLTGVTE